MSLDKFERISGSGGVLSRHAPSLTAGATAFLITIVFLYAGLKTADAVLGADMPSSLSAMLPKIGMFRRLVTGSIVAAVVAPAAVIAARRNVARTFNVLRHALVVAAFLATLQAVLVP